MSGGERGSSEIATRAKREYRRRARRAAERIGIALCIAMSGCASVAKSASDFDGGGSGSSSGGFGSGPSGSDTSSHGDFGAGGVLGDGAAASVSTSGDAGVGGDAGQEQVCTDAGCTCIRIASIGHAGVWGACGMNGDSTGAFETWLNTQSTASVDSYASAKPLLTAAFLAQYDVIILQWLRDVPDAGNGEGMLWQFSQDEVNALADWVQAGGGLITMSGYDGDGQEVVPLNALLSFAGLVYNVDGTYGSTCTGSNCWGGACALTAWNTAGPIGAHLMEVGIQNGRSISIAADAGYSPVVDCPCPNGNDCAVHEDIGKGHVFAFSDEWVTYTSQWLGTASCIPSSCAGSTPADDFQVPQFWYNAISYASQSVQCRFTINNPTIIPR
jgi:hypothetical protein